MQSKVDKMFITGTVSSGKFLFSNYVQYMYIQKVMSKISHWTTLLIKHMECGVIVHTASPKYIAIDTD